MKLPPKTKSEQNKEAAAQLLADLEAEEISDRQNSFETRPTSARQSENKLAAHALLSALEEEFESSSSSLAMYGNSPSESPEASKLPTSDCDETVAVSKTREEKPVIKGKQTRNKPVTGKYKTRNKPVTARQVGLREKAETRNKPVSQPVTDFLETRNKPVIELSFSNATVFQRKILTFVFSEMTKSAEKMTPPITLSHFGERLGRTDSKAFESLRIVIWRLEKSGLLLRPQLKNGRGGWTRYSLPINVYSEIRDAETRNKPVMEFAETRNKPVSQPVTAASSKLVSDLNNNLLTSEPEPTVDNSSSLELEPVSKFGISKKHLQDIRNQKLNLSTLDLQDLITRFGIYASDPANIRGVRNLPALFMKMAQQLAAGENMLEGIETPEDQALAKILKDRTAQKARKQETEDALLTFEFEAWLESLPAEKRNELVPESAVVRAGSHAQTVMLKKYYVENFWIGRRSELLSQAGNLNLTV